MNYQPSFRWCEEDLHLDEVRPEPPPGSGDGPTIDRLTYHQGMSKIRYRYHTLEDFLVSNMATVDGTLDDGWGGTISVKGREIEATVLFCDIADFSARTRELTPTETLIFANHFFTWMTAEAIGHSKGIIDKYIGDEVMIVFSKEFGSEDPFEDAVRVACSMYQFDAFAFAPHVGIASGRVIIGYAGTAIRYNCSVFGSPVALAARCAGVRQEPSEEKPFSGAVVFPSAEWGDRDLRKIVPPTQYKFPDGTVQSNEAPLQLLAPRTVDIKNLPPLEIREIANSGFHWPQRTAEEWAQAAAEVLRKGNRLWPRVDLGTSLPSRTSQTE
jgi:class 3 adenylate cyclase